MIIKATDKKIRYSERWWESNEMMVCTANGGTAEFKFTGEMCILTFDTSTCVNPYPHIYISVDNGAKIEVPIHYNIRIASDPGEHYVKIILKSSEERQHRWFEPIEARVKLVSLEADSFGELEPDERPSIEFIGDSITEGVLTDDATVSNAINKSEGERVWRDDATATYAWLTAEKLNLRPIIMGYGAVGTTKAGCGAVPKVYESYPNYCHNNPMPSANADYIVINHGANDAGAKDEVVFSEYKNFLGLVRDRNPKSKIISLTPFSGRKTDVIKKAVEAHNSEKSDNVYIIDSTGWVPPEPLHPLRDGHKIIAEHLSEILKKEIM